MHSSSVARGHPEPACLRWPDVCTGRGSNQHPEPGRPHLHPDLPCPKLRVEIADTGYGISPQDQERIFDRFYRVENAVHTEVGTGLGLSIVRGILEKHGSKVSAW
jgi:two-component system sensor histidine kinase NblS